ncbi:MAG: NADH-quinone oxidoreductase subunit M [Peptococcaceae bacterium]|nr:NADH-quinone oxidoreductase subunit M [Peptococcaceae bacterium]
MNSLGFPILSLITLMPIICAVVIFFIPSANVDAMKKTAIGFMGLNLLLTLFMFAQYDVDAGGMQFVENVTCSDFLGINYIMAVDGISAPLMLLTSLIIFAGSCISFDMNTRTKEFFIFLMILVCGVYGVFASQNLLFFYIFFELALVPMYTLVGVWGSVRKDYAAMKLVLYLLIGSVFVLVGIISMYLYGGTVLGHLSLNMDELAQVPYTTAFQTYCYAFLALGFGFLVKMFPFHTWSPLGYAAAPTAVSMLHAGVIVKLGAYGLIRCAVSFFPEGAQYWAPVIGLLCMVNIIYGAFIAMVQKDMKLFVGYACVSHMGYILLGVSTLNLMSLSGAVSQMVAHGLMMGLFFSVIGYIYHEAGTRDITAFGGLAKQMPRAAVLFSLAALACLGLPGMFNFVAEFLIFMGTFTSDKLILGFISYQFMAVVAISGIVITATYCLRAVRIAFMGPRNPKWDKLHDIHGIYLVGPCVLVIALFIFGCYPHGIGAMIESGVAPLASAIESNVIGGIF